MRLIGKNGKAITVAAETKAFACGILSLVRCHNMDKCAAENDLFMRSGLQFDFMLNDTDFEEFMIT